MFQVAVNFIQLFVSFCGMATFLRLKLKLEHLSASTHMCHHFSCFSVAFFLLLIGSPLGVAREGEDMIGPQFLWPEHPGLQTFDGFHHGDLTSKLVVNGSWMFMVA